MFDNFNPSPTITERMDEKGKANGLCNRGACLKPYTVYWKHTLSGFYYCQECAFMINDVPHHQREYPDGLVQRDDEALKAFNESNKEYPKHVTEYGYLREIRDAEDKAFLDKMEGLVKKAKQFKTGLNK